MKQIIKRFLITVFFAAIFSIPLYANDLKWDASTGDVSGYTIYYGLSSGSYPFSEDVGNVTQYSLDNFSLSEGTTYYFMVRAYNASGESGDSNVTTYAVPSLGDTTPPLSPGGVTGEIVNEEILLAWNASSEIDISMYRVYYGTSTRNYGLPIPVEGTEYSITGLEPSVPYYFAVTAVDTSGNESGYSSPEIVKTISVDFVAGDLQSKIFGAVSGADFPQAIEDSYLNAGAADTNTSDSFVSLNTYTWPTDTAANRIVMNCDVSVLPQDAVISKAKLSLYMYGYDGSGGDDEYEITAHKIINNKPVVSTSTWNTYNGINSWTGGNNGGEQDLAPAEVSVVVDKNVGYKEFDITQMVKGWVADPSTNFGLMLNSDSTASSDSNRYFRPTEYSNPDMRPKLIVEYYGSDVASTDATAPAVTITSPTSGTGYDTNSASLNIGGTASDAVGVTQVSWTNSRGGSGTATGTTSWSAAGISLGEGENVVTVTARDAAGNTATDILTVVYTIPDATAPAVTITSPTSGTGYDTNSASLNIGGTASDAVGVTQVSWINSRGGSGTATGTTSWSAAGISLGEGENVVTVTARDAAGNTATDILTVVYTIPDVTAPAVTITSPTSGTGYDTNSASLNIGGTASDAVGVTQVSWINSRGGSGTATGTTSWSATGISLGEGDNVITITARDAAGNAATDILTVVYTIPDATAPAVTITSPTSGTGYDTNSASLNIGGTASDAVGVTQVSWINSRGGSGTATGTTSWSATGISLGEGDNVITITARDAAGNAATDILTVVYTIPDATAPAVTITSPTSGTGYDTNSASLNIGGTASDAVGVTQVSWTNSRGGSGSATGTTSWSAAGISLGEGENVVTVTARDAAGNTATDILTVVYTIPDATAPAVTITSPTSGTGYDTNSASLNIGGTASDAVGVTQVSWTNSRGGSGSATGTTSWSAAGISLGEGENVVTVTARDAAGNTATDILTVVYTIPDATAPAVTITSPTSGTGYDTNSASLNIGGTASDAVGVTQVSWTNSRGGSGTATGTTNWSTAGITLAEGENVITITARDAAGNTATDILTVVYTIPDATAPAVTITSPTSGTSYNTNSAILNIGGTASDAVGVTQVSWTNSRGGSGPATGTTNWSTAGISLAEGENVITITARDAAGNTATDILTVVYTIPVLTDTQSPVLTLNKPTTGGFYFTRSAAILLSGTASDNVGVKEVNWAISQGGSGVANGTSNWEAASVPLARWWNNITITAEDEAGNKTAYNLTVFSWR